LIIDYSPSPSLPVGAVRVVRRVVVARAVVPAERRVGLAPSSPDAALVLVRRVRVAGRGALPAGAALLAAEAAVPAGGTALLATLVVGVVVPAAAGAARRRGATGREAGAPSVPGAAASTGTRTS